MRNKELKKLLKEAEQRGWFFVQAKKHIKGRHSVTGKMVCTSITPSDHRALLNIDKDLRRAEV